MTSNATPAADLATLRARCATLFDEVNNLRDRIAMHKRFNVHCPWLNERAGVPAMEARLVELIEERRIARNEFKAARAAARS